MDIRRGYIDPPVERVHTGSGARHYHAETPSFPVESPKTGALVLAVSMREGGRLTDLGDEVNELVRRFNEAYPIGLHLDPIVFQPNDVQEVVDSFVSNLVQAIVVVMGAMLVFLGLRTGLIISTLIPMAMMTTLLVMRLTGIGLDQISLAALIIALGMLVDNGVVMAESIMVGMESGLDAREASLRSSRELSVPLLTASLNLVAIVVAEIFLGDLGWLLLVVASIGVRVLLTAFLVSATCLLYLDSRVRVEGLDLELLLVDEWPEARR